MVLPVKTAKMVTPVVLDLLDRLDQLDLPDILARMEDLGFPDTVDYQEKMAKMATLEVQAKMARTVIQVDQDLRELLEALATMELQERTVILEPLVLKAFPERLVTLEHPVRMEHQEQQATSLAQLDLLVLQA